MEVKVIKNNEDLDCECVVRQKNSSPLPVYDLTPAFKNGVLYISVPFRMSSVTCQVDSETRDKLENCYFNCIKTANEMGFKSIGFPQLGVDLYWEPVQSASAARVSVLKILNDIPDDFRVVFWAEGDDFEIWDGVMRF